MMSRSVNTREVSSVVGFTLLELLVVIAIIGILAGLLLPVLNQAKAKVRTVICLGHLKQWGTATHLYLLDHDDYLPPDGTPNPGRSSTNHGWYIQLPRELGLPAYHAEPWHTNPAAALPNSIWLCPSNPRKSNGKNLFHYCLNAYVNGTGSDNRPVRWTQIAKPTTLVWLFDSKNLPAVGYWGYSHTNLHSGGANFTFLDGHAQRFQREAYWNDKTNKGRTDNPVIRWIP